jgi:predicted heme/steroid binding protein
MHLVIYNSPFDGISYNFVKNIEWLNGNLWGIYNNGSYLSDEFDYSPTFLKAIRIIMIISLEEL